MKKSNENGIIYNKSNNGLCKSNNGNFTSNGLINNPLGESKKINQKIKSFG